MKAIFDDGMQYELNKWYKIDMPNEIKPCEYDYHYFDNIRDIFGLFCDRKYDIYEVEVRGDIIKDNDKDYNGKYVCSEIRLIRKLSKEEINKYIEDNLDKLINDKDWRVRTAVTEQGYRLDKLINDKSWQVRIAVVKQGYGLDKLVNDEECFVRAAVAEQGYGLDKLVNDENYWVRKIAKSKLN